MSIQTIHIPLNRVEGDIEVTAEINDNVVTDARCSGVMFRGFENFMIGRGPLDGLVITPRICGICSTGHLFAAAKALDMIAKIKVPPDAIRLRNIALMTEKIQSDIRHTFLMFTADFINPIYQDISLFEEAVQRYDLYHGRTVLEVIRQTRKFIGIIAIIGGQWPHSSYMVPGGVVSVPTIGDILQCKLLLKQFQHWYETQILGCQIDRWNAIKNLKDLNDWVDESDSHRNSDVGFFIRFCKEIGMDIIGKGHSNYISFGAFDIPNAPDNRLIRSGFFQNHTYELFDQSYIEEDITYSWFKNHNGSKHPFCQKTNPYATGEEGIKYSWAKAPRYKGKPAETGPFAERIISQDPLFLDILSEKGASVFLRQLARLIRPATLIPVMDMWLNEISQNSSFYNPPGVIKDGEGFGLMDVTRGALGHWVKIRNGKIDHYQIITPTAWNASPRDSSGVRGPIEEALVGTFIKDINNPVELGHIVRSFDACLVCTVHTIC